MNQRTLGKTNLKVSEIGFGAAPAAFLKAERESAAAMIRALLDAGVNLIDTAAAYPGSEAFIGEFLSDRRSDYVLVSKCGNIKAPGTTGDPWTPQLIESTVDRALQLMKTDHLDVMLLHSCDLATLQKGDALATLIKARDAGKIRHVGYSGDNAAAAWACAQPDIAVVETSINIVDQANVDAVLPAAAKHNVGIIAKRPIANACWRGKAAMQGIYVNYVAEYIKRFEAMKLSPADLGIAENEWGELALRFTLSHPEVSCAIVGTTNLENAKRNIAASGKGELAPQQLAVLRDRFDAARAGVDWPGLT
jgi:aryl-alcohol dehydrogenase-like predicted oxidoreductase